MTAQREKNEREAPEGLPPFLFKRKAAGWVFMNGNIPNPGDFVTMFADKIRNPQHPDPEINEERRVTLVTAAYDKGHEFNDRHHIHDFEQIGIDAGWQGGYPTRVRNLSVWNHFNTWKKKEKWLYRRYTEKQDAILAITEDYYKKMEETVERAVATLNGLKEDYPDLGLYEFYQLETWQPDGSTVLSESVRANERIEKDLTRLKKRRTDLTRVLELRNLIEHLVYKDSEVLAACKAIEDHFKYASGLEKSQLYVEQREALRQTLLNAATIFIYGGRVYVLMNRLRFYDLQKTLRLAVEQGANLFGISAGSVIQSNQFSLALPDAPSGGHLIAADEGVGLIENIRIFPHVYDYQPYVRDGSRDDLTFFALRHPGNVAVGLNQTSVLLREVYRCAKDGKTYLRYSSVGDDPVLVFGPRGRRYEMLKGDQLLLPGTRGFSGAFQLARLEEIEAAETECEEG